MATTTNDGSALGNTSGSWTSTTNLYDGDAATFTTTPATNAIHYIEAATYNFGSVIATTDSLTSVQVAVRHYCGNISR